VSVDVNDLRWGPEAVAIVESVGWSVVDVGGVDDWQGCGVLLLHRAGDWATLAWSYGTCSGCDEFEDMSDAELRARFLSDLSIASCESAARVAFAEGDGW
jgi:hypothetical protein